VEFTGAYWVWMRRTSTPPNIYINQQLTLIFCFYPPTNPPSFLLAFIEGLWVSTSSLFWFFLLRTLKCAKAYFQSDCQTLRRERIRRLMGLSSQRAFAKVQSKIQIWNGRCVGDWCRHGLDRTVCPNLGKSCRAPCAS